MGVSTTISLALFSLILVMGLGIFLSMVAISLRINDPARVNLVTDHIREELKAFKNFNNNTVTVYNRWQKSSYIEYVLVVNKGMVVSKIKLDNPIEIPSLEKVNLDCNQLKLEGNLCVLVFNNKNPAQPLYNLIIITKNGNSFTVLSQ